jgi:hypothetical protein
MYKNVSATARISTDYTLISYHYDNAYDSNYTKTFWLVIICGVLDIVLVILSWMPFSAYYSYMKDQKDMADSAVTSDDSADAYSAYDEYGCNAYGVDVDGNPCPAAY